MFKESHEKKLCVFVDTLTHLRSARIIIDELDFKEIHIITTSDTVSKKISNETCTKISSIFHLVYFLLNQKKLRDCNSLLAARVDSIYFQILYFFIGFKNLLTFDEGLFTIQENSRYNSKILNKQHFSKPFYWFNRLISFPKSPSYFYKITSKHFSYFAIDSFKTSAINRSKVEYIINTRKLNRMKNIFIGQPWQTMFLSQNNIEDLKIAIESLGISLYIAHPREDLEIIANSLSESIVQISCSSPAEDFLEIINDFGPFNFFIMASTVAISISNKHDITLLSFKNQSNEISQIQENLEDALLAKKMNFSKISI